MANSNQDWRLRHSKLPVQDYKAIRQKKYRTPVASTSLYSPLNILNFFHKKTNHSLQLETLQPVPHNSKPAPAQQFPFLVARRIQKNYLCFY